MDDLGQLPIVQLHEIRLCLEGELYPRGREVDQRATAVGADVGDEVTVELERERVSGQGVGDNEPAARDRFRARQREQIIELVA